MGTLYESIVSLCAERGIKPGKMCNEANISRGLITDLKTGRKQSIKVETAQKIADYFGVSVDRVLGEEKKEKPTLVSERERNIKDDNLIKWFRSLPPEKQKAILIAQDGPIDVAD